MRQHDVQHINKNAASKLFEEEMGIRHRDSHRSNGIGNLSCQCLKALSDSCVF